MEALKRRDHHRALIYTICLNEHRLITYLLDCISHYVIDQVKDYKNCVLCSTNYGKSFDLIGWERNQISIDLKTLLRSKG